jgi:hypothetical protein
VQIFIKQIKTTTMTTHDYELGYKQKLAQLKKQTQQKETYNGWTNYETWRIALEWFDNYNLDEQEMDAYELSLQLREYVENTLDETIVQNAFVIDYALAFVSNVNWYEIAEHIIEEQNNK